MRYISLLLFHISLILSLAACYNNHTDERSMGPLDSMPTRDTVYMEVENKTADLRSPYGLSYNFLVVADSMALLRQQPEVAIAGYDGSATDSYSNPAIDTVAVYKGDRIAVADIRIVLGDTRDTVWVQVARDEQVFGWLHETEMLDGVVPDDPISLFIYTFSNVHLLITLVLVCIFAVAYLMRKMLKQSSKMLHFNDIHSFYPTLLALLVASSATLYSSIQMFAPATWQHFYYYPTLNPLTQPVVISVFLVSVWAIVIVAIAVIDVVVKLLPTGGAMHYMAGLIGICAVDYIIFSISTLYYVGYPLLIAYYVYAIRRYLRHSSYKYECGHCGRRLRKKGSCPQCGTVNE